MYFIPEQNDFRKFGYNKKVCIERIGYFMDINAYLERIKYKGSLQPTKETLSELQIHHIQSIPFENLSIHNHESIVLQNELLFEKIVVKKRGGFCFELNGLFADLLRSLGYHVSMLSAGVAKSNGGFGPDFDHMALMVLLEDRWLVDVGFGDLFQEPLLIDSRDIQPQRDRSYKIDEDGNYLLLNERKNGDTWKTQYRFSLNSFELKDFSEMCIYHQVSADSMFTQKRICSIAKPKGRVTLSDMRMIETTDSERLECVLTDESEYKAILEKEFEIVL